MSDLHEVHVLATGKTIDISQEQLPGVVDRFYGTPNGLAFAVCFDDDDSLRIGCIDVKAGSLRWQRVVGWGNRTYYADPLRYPSGFVSFMLANKGSSYFANDAERMAALHATRYNPSTKMMEPDYAKQSMAMTDGVMDRAIARTMRLMAEEARRPIPNLAKGISPHLTYADANLVSNTDTHATMLIYGGIYRPTAERAEFPDGEGLLTFDLATGASTFTHIAIYGNENTAGDFNADHMSDVRDMGNGLFCAFGDTAIIYITDKGATRVGFKTLKIAHHKGTLDKMWVVDIDPDTELFSYITLTYDRASATATTRLMAQTDQPCYQVADWPTSDVAFSMVDYVLTLYPTAPTNAQSFVGLTPTYVVPSDTIESHRYADFYDEDEETNFGIRLTNSHVVVVGRDAIGFFPTNAPMCSAVIPTEEWPSKTNLHYRQLGSSILRETSTKLRILNVGPSCAVQMPTDVTLDNDHKAYIVKDGVVIVDNDAKTVSLYR
ncbi:MAG: hypothetical protein EHM43_06690 [Ignavibacteriae bacterium]|nr:MAG: hypothetical protein EHM43_06690 [Ignavibacteriota bacterium]